MNPRAKVFKEYVEALIIALILAFFIRTFVVQAFKIPSGSMLNTLLIGDHLLVSKFKYGVRMPFTDIVILPLSDPQLQDIVVFEYPQDTSKDFIKRVVGLPGDAIEIRDKVVYRNGQPLNEPYAQYTDHRILPGPRDNMAPIVVPPGRYFVMGDNRDESLDSRFWGTVERGAILGKAWIIYWSWGGIGEIRWDRMGSSVH